MKIKRCLGVTAYLKSANEGVAFFRDVLGAKIGPDIPQTRPYGHRAFGTWIGEEEPFRIELAESIDDELVIGKQIKKYAPCYSSVTLEVENIDEAIKELRDKGIKVSDKIPFDFDWCEYCYEAMIHPKSATGLKIELIEWKLKPGAEKGIW